MFRVFNCLANEHDWRLVVLAGAICLFASLVAISLFHRARAASGGARTLWLALAGAAGGCGIWATHFIAMLAYEPGIPVAYGIGLTATSLALAIAVTFVGVTVAVHVPARWAAPLGGAIFGIGVACMHNTGMFALEVPGVLAWLGGLVALSIALGIVFGAIALTVATRRDDLRGTLAASTLLTLAIVSHHFVAMGAAVIIPNAGWSEPGFSLDDPALAIAIAGIAVAILSMSLIGAVADSFLAARTRQFDLDKQGLIETSEQKLRQQNMRLDAALNNMTQGLCMFDANERIVVLNRRYLEMYRLSPEVVRPGCSLRDLIRHRKDVGLLDADPETYYRSIIEDVAKDHRRPLLIQKRDGRIIQAINERMPDGGWVTTHEDVTDRHNAETLLREQKLQLDAALNNMSQGLCMFDGDERIVVVNRRFMEMYKLSPEVARPGCSLIDLLRHRHSTGQLIADPEEFRRRILKDVADGRDRHVVTHNRDRRIIEVMNERMPGGGWVTTHEDVTDQHNAETQLREQKLQLDAALDNMAQGLCTYDADGKLVVFNRRYLEMYGLEPGTVTPGMTLEQLLKLRRAKGSFDGDAAQYMESLLARLAQGELVTASARTLDGRIISILNRPMPGGRWVATHDDITERQQAAEKLNEQKLQLDTALDNMVQGLQMYDAQARIVLCNDRFLKMYRLPATAVTPGTTTLEDMMRLVAPLRKHPMSPDVLARKVRDGMAKGKAVDLLIELRDGRFIAIENQPISDGRWVVTHEDVIDRHNAEAQVRDQKLQLDTALENMAQGLCKFDADGKLALVNRRYLEMYDLRPETVKPGITVEQMLELRRAAGSFDGDVARYIENLQDGLLSGKPFTAVARTKDGRIISVVNRPMADGSWVATHDDITERQQAAEQLRDQKLHLDTALNSMSQGLNMFDAAGRLVVCNQRYLDMYKLSADVVKPGCTIDDLVKARLKVGTFFAVDPTEYAAKLQLAISQRDATSSIMETTDGRIIAVNSQTTPDGSGWVVTHEDITERRHAEEERDRSRTFASTVFENVPTAITVKDAQDLRNVLVNRAAEKALGLPRSQIIGKTALDMFPSEIASSIIEEDRVVLKAGETAVMDEHPIKMLNGETRIVSATRTPVRNQNGNIQYLLTVTEDRTQRRRAEAQLAHMTHHDALTGLPNRTAFNECLNSIIEAAARDKSSFALMSIDSDRFKEINDVFGHNLGDKLLRELAQRIQQAAGGAFVARLGGDEFTVIATDDPQPAAAEALADRILSAVAKDFMIDGQLLRTTVSLGIAVYPVDGNDAPGLIANADAALYRAKQEGRGTYRFFEADMDKRLRDRRVLQQDLQTAIERDEMTLHYQPQARINGEIIGFEALVRWHHPTRGMVAPGAFISLAEDSGLIVAMGEWVLRHACREAASWPKPLQIAINLSPVQFRHGDLPALVHSVLLETGLAPSRLELEITEGVLIGDFSRAVSILRRLKSLGVHIAMDDFGSGYSSLSYLQAFPFDKIKIDQAFISNLERSAQSTTIVRAVIGLARGLGLPVLAEGVETKEQFAFLAKENCDEIQGYLVGRPMPIENYAELTGQRLPPQKLTLVAS